MPEAFAVALRVLRQFKHDPRTIFMMIVGPILALAILNAIFGAPDYEPLILTVRVDQELRDALTDADARVEYSNVPSGLERLRKQNADAVLVSEDESLTVYVEGSDPAKTALVKRSVAEAQLDALAETGAKIGNLRLPGGLEAEDIAPPEPEIIYVHGNDDMKGFDFYGPVFIGTFVFFFVFITAGISFVRERTGGTLERVMATPVKRWSVVLGYMMGFGAFALLQTIVVAAASIYWVGFPNFGLFPLVLLVAVSMALVSMTLGILVSEFAQSELQVMQLMQIIVVPQILLSGMFDLSQTPMWMQALGRAFPLSYGADAMRAVMLRNASLADVAPDLAVLWAFILGLFVLNVVALKKYRRI